MLSRVDIIVKSQLDTFNLNLSHFHRKNTLVSMLLFEVNISTFRQNLTEYNAELITEMNIRKTAIGFIKVLSSTIKWRLYSNSYSNKI